MWFSLQAAIAGASGSIERGAEFVDDTARVFLRVLTTSIGAQVTGPCRFCSDVVPIASE